MNEDTQVSWMKDIVDDMNLDPHTFARILKAASFSSKEGDPEGNPEV